MFEILPNWHPLFVHFTVAISIFSLLMYVVLNVAQRYSIRNQALVVARWSLWFVGGVTLLTLAAGLYAYNTVDHDNISHLVMTTHKNWALVAALLLLLSVVWSLWYYKKDREEGGFFVGLLAVAVALIVVTAWYGGELVYRHGLGVQSLPGGHCEKCRTRRHDTLLHSDELMQPMDAEPMDDMPASQDEQHGGDGHDHSH